MLKTNHIRQGNEPTCMLATIAMLTGNTMPVVKGYADTICILRYGMDYCKAIKAESTDFDFIVRLVSRKFGFNFTEYRRQKESFSLRILMEGKCTQYKPRHDKGALVIAEFNTEGRVGHIVAYEQGFIFDSALSYCMPFDMWVRHPKNNNGFILADIPHKEKGV